MPKAIILDTEDVVRALLKFGNCKAEAAAFLGVSTATLRKALKRNLQLGNEVFYRQHPDSYAADIIETHTDLRLLSEGSKADHARFYERPHQRVLSAAEVARYRKRHGI